MAYGYCGRSVGSCSTALSCGRPRGGGDHQHGQRCGARSSAHDTTHVHSACSSAGGAASTHGSSSSSAACQPPGVDSHTLAASRAGEGLPHLVFNDGRPQDHVVAPVFARAKRHAHIYKQLLRVPTELAAQVGLQVQHDVRLARVEGGGAWVSRGGKASRRCRRRRRRRPWPGRAPDRVQTPSAGPRCPRSCTRPPGRSCGSSLRGGEAGLGDGHWGGCADAIGTPMEPRHPPHLSLSPLGTAPPRPCRHTSLARSVAAARCVTWCCEWLWAI